MMRRVMLLFFAIALLDVPAVAQHTPMPQSTVAAPGAADFIIGPDDVLDISVFDVPELSHQYRVDPRGTISVPLLPEPLKAGGLTPEQLADRLANELRERGLVSDPHVSVVPRESRGHSVAITGAVRNPQIFPVLGQTHLLDLISQAGGLTDNAGSTARITRATGSAADASASPQIITIDLKKLFDGSDASLNVPIRSGDWINVPQAGVVYIVGAVNHPGVFPLNTSHQQLTVLEALALAQDTKPTAMRSKAMIVRRGEQYPDGRKEIPVDLGQLASGKQFDEPLLANDILFVPDGTAKKALRRSAEAAIQIATGFLWRY